MGRPRGPKFVPSDSPRARILDLDARADAGARSGEAAMWAAVIGQAWLDAFSATNLGRKADIADLDRASARPWHTLDHGDYGRDRALVCSLAGIDPDFLRDAARRRLRMVRADQRPQVDGVDRLLAHLVESAGRMSAAAIDDELARLAALELEAV